MAVNSPFNRQTGTFGAYQQQEKLGNAYASTNRPISVHYDNSAKIAAIREKGKQGAALFQAIGNINAKWQEAKALEADNEYNRLIAEGVSDLMTRKEGGAENVVADYDKLHKEAYDKVMKRHGNALRYTDAGIKMRYMIDRDNVTRRTKMVEYQTAQLQAYWQTQFENARGQVEQDLENSLYSDEAFAQAREKLSVLIEDHYKDWGEDKVAVEKDKAMTALVEQGIAYASARNDTPRLKELNDKYAPYITSKTRVALSSLIENRREKESLMGLADELCSANEFTSLQDCINYYEANNTGTPKGNISALTDAILESHAGQAPFTEAQWQELAKAAGFDTDAPMSQENIKKVVSERVKTLYDENDGDISKALTAFYNANDKSEADLTLSDNESPSIHDRITDVAGRLNDIRTTRGGKLSELELQEKGEKLYGEVQRWQARLADERKSIIQKAQIDMVELMANGVIDPSAYENIALSSSFRNGKMDYAIYRALMGDAGRAGGGRRSGSGGRSGGSGGGRSGGTGGSRASGGGGDGVALTKNKIKAGMVAAYQNGEDPLTIMKMAEVGNPDDTLDLYTFASGLIKGTGAFGDKEKLGALEEFVKQINPSKAFWYAAQVQYQNERAQFVKDNHREPSLEEAKAMVANLDDEISGVSVNTGDGSRPATIADIINAGYLNAYYNEERGEFGAQTYSQTPTGVNYSQYGFNVSQTEEELAKRGIVLDKSKIREMEDEAEEREELYEAEEESRVEDEEVYEWSNKAVTDYRQLLEDEGWVEE